MAVITKYVVVRDGVELDKEFLVKKEAEAYDKMLDAAENLAAFIKDAGPEINLDDKAVNAISIFLAKNGPEVTRILKGLKPIGPPAKKPEEKQETVPAAAPKKKAPAAKAKPRRK